MTGNITIGDLMAVMDEKRACMRQSTKDINEEIDRLLLKREAIEAPYREAIIDDLKQVARLGTQE